MKHLPSFPRLRWGALLLALLLPLAACTDQPTAAPGADALLNKGGGKNGGGGTGSGSDEVRVTSVDPAYGQQGEIRKRVRVFGSGFDDASHVSWERGGVVAAGITTHGTRFISASELEAEISIASDAELDLYDVVVTNSKVRKGIGTEMFEVTTAESIGTLGGNTNSTAINEAGQVVGYSMMGNVQYASYWDASTGMTPLTPGVARDIDRNGQLIGGGNSEGPVIWTRTQIGSWSPAQPLPSANLGGTVVGVASSDEGYAFLLVGHTYESAGRNKTIQYATIWTKDGSGWVRRTLPTASGFFSWAQDVNWHGQVVGNVRSSSTKGDTGPKATLWERVNGVHQATAQLAPLPGRSDSEAHAINNAGDIIVGSSGRLPVYWRRENGAWGGAQPLEAGNGNCGQQYARSINDAGWIVGRVCDGSAFLAALWRGPGAPREALGGLGFGRGDSTAHGINNAGVIAGHARGAKTREGVIWRMVY